MRALVFLNGDLYLDAWGITPELRGSWDFIICADGGGRYALQLGVQPDMLLGDFDSITLPELQLINADDLRSFRTDKDYTDGELAVREVLRRGATDVTLAGAFGGRLDHALGNIGLLRLLRRQGASGAATDGRQCAWLVTPDNSPFLVQGSVGELISVLPFTINASGVSLAGTRWPLQNATLEIGESRTISNELIDTCVQVTVEQGELLIIKSHGRTT